MPWFPAIASPLWGVGASKLRPDRHRLARGVPQFGITRWHTEEMERISMKAQPAMRLNVAVRAGAAWSLPRNGATRRLNVSV